MEDTIEQWRPVPGYEGLYEVSNLRRVRSVARTEQIGGSLRLRAGTILRLDQSRAMLSRDGAQKRVNVNRLADQVFPDQPIELPEELGEIWRPIPNFEQFYEISNRHRVRAFARETDGGRYRKARMLKTSLNNGFLVAWLCPNGREPYKLYLERAVIDVFPETKEDNIPLLPGEEWKDIRGYEGLYRISNLGRVLSMDRIINHGDAETRYVRRRLMERGSDGNGYPKTELSKDRTPRTFLIHRLVADAFVPNPLDLECVHHRDEDKRNCRADNLEWISRVGNVQDWFDRRRLVIGADTIASIGAAIAAGKSPAEILAALPRRQKTKK